MRRCNQNFRLEHGVVGQHDVELRDVRLEVWRLGASRRGRAPFPHDRLVDGTGAGVTSRVPSSTRSGAVFGHRVEVVIGEFGPIKRLQADSA